MKAQSPAEVLVVHCVDTEGVLHEDHLATFERISETYGINIEPTQQALRDIQNGTHAETYSLQGIKEFVSGQQTSFVSDLKQHKQMLDHHFQYLLRKVHRCQGK